MGGRDHPRGRVLAGTTRGRGYALRRVGTAAPTSSPASRSHAPIARSWPAPPPPEPSSRRRLTRQGRWSTPERVGQPGSWATHTAPVLGNDGAGAPGWWPSPPRGATFAQRLERGRIVRVPGDAASITSTPALTTCRGRHHPPPPDQRGRTAERSHPRRPTLEPTRRPRWRLVALRLPRCRRARRPPPRRGRRPARRGRRTCRRAGRTLPVPGTRPFGRRPHPVPRAGDPQQRRRLRRGDRPATTAHLAVADPARLRRRRHVRPHPGGLHRLIQLPE